MFKCMRLYLYLININLILNNILIDLFYIYLVLNYFELDKQVKTTTLHNS